MRHWILCFASVISLPLQAAQDDDFWLYLDAVQARSSLGLSAGAYESGGQYQNVQLRLALTNDFFLDASAEQQNTETTTSGWNAAIGNASYAPLEWQIHTNAWGESDVIQTRDTGLFLTRHGQEWSFGLGYENGDLELFTNNFINQQSGSLEHEARHVSLDWLRDRIGWGMEWVKHDYEKDLRGLNDPRLRFIIKPDAIGQASALALRESRFYVVHYWQDDSLNISLSRIQSAVTRDILQYALVTYSHSFNPFFSLGLDTQIPTEEGSASAGINLGLSW